MPHEVFRVADLPFDPVPEYSVKWERPPNDWYAKVSPRSIQFPDNFVGDYVTFTASDPRDISHTTLVEALGMIVVREYDSPTYENTLQFIQDQSVLNGAVIGKFEYFPAWFSMHMPEAHQYPRFSEAKKEANAFVHGIRTERGATR